MIKVLKTLNQIKQEYRYTKQKGSEHNQGINIFHKSQPSFINHRMYDLFGKEINVRLYHDSQGLFHYEEIKQESSHGWVFHKDWFIPEDFFNEKDFIL